MSEVIALTNSAGEPKDEIIETPTLQALHGLINKVQRNPKLGILVVIGPPGVGKTTALKAYQRGRPADYCKMTTAHDSLGTGLRHIGEAMGIPLLDTMASKMFDTLARDMCERASYREPGRRPILMIDEAQDMSDRLIQTVRSLYDRCNEGNTKPGYGLVLCGNATFPERFSRARFEQLLDRIFTIWTVKAPEIGDLEAICQHFGIADARAVKLLEHQALTGSLRRVVRIMKFARVAHGPKKPLDGQAIASTIELLGYAKN
jgi:DNA transposition AAA+ family ATPase